MAAKNLSKENLKNELIAHNIPLPPSGSKKEKYLELYEKHISANENNFRSEFSSDEDDAARSPKMRVKRSIFTSLTTSSNSSTDMANNSFKNILIDGVNITQLSDDELRFHLAKFNQTVGPVVASTRAVYERKLAKLLQGDVGEEINYSPQEDEYSDSEDETESRHSAIQSPGYSSNRIPEMKRQENITDNSSSTKKNKPNDDSAFTRLSFSRDSPTPRRSIRPNITYTLSDRKLVNSSIHLSNNRKVELGKLASTVVEQIQEPVQPKRSIYLTVLKIVAVIAVLLLIFLVYQNMEANGGENVAHLPGDNSPLESKTEI